MVPTPSRFCQLITCVACGVLLAGAASAQEAAQAPVDREAAAAPPPEPSAWRWTTNANVFFGFNHQQRKFRDFSAWESQNWLMAAGERDIPNGSVRLTSMFSLEPFTIQDIGSPQAFQTGETFQRAPLVDYQHPHDLFMNLGAELRRSVGRARLIVGVDLVGAPTVGPEIFMHRPSGVDNPQAPLSHHHLDSTHSTAGVLRGAILLGAWRLEGSRFRGREADENRTDLDLGALDSYAVRLVWTHGPWSAQLSGADLKEPEFVTPYDARRLTASVAHTTVDGDRSIAWLAAVGQNREIHGNLEAYLLEAAFRPTRRHSIYGRIESVAKDILDAGFHPRGTFHRHRQSQVGAFTAGYIREILQTRVGSFGLGGDVTAYIVPRNLKDAYGSPASFHVFLRYRARPLFDAAHHH